MLAKKMKQLCLALCKRDGFLFSYKFIFVRVEYKPANGDIGLRITYDHFISSQENLHPGKQLFHAEWLHNIVVTTSGKTFQFVFFKRFCSQEQNRDPVTFLPDLFGKTESVPVRHIHIQDAEVRIALLKMFPGSFSIGAIDNLVARFFKIVFNNKSQLQVILSEQDLYLLLHTVLFLC